MSAGSAVPRGIPQTDPRASYMARRAEIDAAVERVLAGGRYVLGPEVAAFETEFADYLGTGHAVGVGSGTEALHLALRAAGVGAGDFVLTVSHTAVATAAAIELCGAAPVFVDIDPGTFTMDPGSLEDTIRGCTGARIAAVVPVHLYGLPADMASIRDIARRYGLRIVEDCAQSHGASSGGRKTGCLGDAAAFSFYPTKNLGAMGDGGMVVTSDPALAERVRLLREYGWRDRYVSSIPGMNSRLDEIQAAILRVKLRYLDADNGARRRLAGLYDAGLRDSGVLVPGRRSGAEHVYHQYVIRSSARDGLRERLKSDGIATLVHYPVPVHQQPAYAARVRGTGGLPRTEGIAGEILSLPMYPELDEGSARFVCERIRAGAAG